MLFCAVSLIGYLIFSAHAGDAPPVAKAVPTDAQTMTLLQSAKSPVNEGDFFEAVEKAIRESRIDWLVAAATNPDKNLKMHVLSTIERLPPAEHCQLWDALLRDENWAKIANGLDNESKQFVHRAVISQTERVVGKDAQGDLSRADFRQKLRMKLQQASAAAKE
jgi:deoxyhypusine synthase